MEKKLASNRVLWLFAIGQLGWSTLSGIISNWLVYFYMPGESLLEKGHTLFIAGANSAKVDVFDMQGRPVFSAKNVKGSIDLKDVSEGLYMVRVRDGSANLTKRIAIK